MDEERRAAWGYVVMWEFRPKPGAEKRFEQMYGPRGRWAQLLERGQGHIGTELNLDSKEGSRYVTLDFWVSEEHYQRFREAYATEYQALDRECEALTEMEREIGRFARLRE
jgi:heme-degrading monooxygenase HmoA